jgi:hypothetical protein
MLPPGGPRPTLAPPTSGSRPARRSGRCANLPVLYKETRPGRAINKTRGSHPFANSSRMRMSCVSPATRTAGPISIGNTDTPEVAFPVVYHLEGLPPGPRKSLRPRRRVDRVATLRPQGPAAMTSIPNGRDTGEPPRASASFCDVMRPRPSSGRPPSWPAVSALVELGRARTDRADSGRCRGLPRPGRRRCGAGLTLSTRRLPAAVPRPHLLSDGTDQLDHALPQPSPIRLHRSDPKIAMSDD